jgi:pimeloyl-ACP methyl ester carboxylesterase
MSTPFPNSDDFRVPEQLPTPDTEVRPVAAGGRIVRANGVDLCAETFGDPGDPAILLVGNSMLSWEDDFCERLAAGSRFVIRYDLRGTGRSVGYDPDAPPYTLRDLVADVVGLLDVFGLGRANLVGFGPGGWIGQLVALDHPDRVASLTLISTRPTAPGPNDLDLPEHSDELMAHFMGTTEPNWTDRAAVIDHMVEAGRQMAGSHPFDEAALRDTVGRIFDRTVDAAPSTANQRSIHRSNQLASSFAVIDHGDRWRERLGEVGAPTLVIHGVEDPFFPHGNALALAKEIPGARQLTLERMGYELPRAVWDVVVPAILRHTLGGPRPTPPLTR